MASRIRGRGVRVVAVNDDLHGAGSLPTRQPAGPGHGHGGSAASPTGCRNNDLRGHSIRDRDAAPRRRPAGRTWSASGTIVWLSSELMFFAALFAMYFTIRSVDKGQGLPWPGAHLDLPLGVDQHDRAGAVQRHLPDGRVRGRARPDQARGSIFNFSKWGLREWYVLSFLMGLYFVCGQGYEYLALVRRPGPDALLQRLRLGVLHDHRVPRPARDRRSDRVPLPARPHLRRQDASPRNSRSARSSCPTTGTSSTSCGSACSPPSTSSTKRRRYRVSIDLIETEAAVSWITARRRRPPPATPSVCWGSSPSAWSTRALTGQGSAGVGARPGTVSSAAIAAGQASCSSSRCSTCHGAGRPGHRAGPEPDRRRRGRGGLPGEHRPDARQGDRRGDATASR